MNDETHIAAIERATQREIRLGNWTPDNRLETQARPPAPVRLPRLAFLDRERFFDWERGK